MQHAVFRFERNKQPEQWIVPMTRLTPYFNVRRRLITIPVKMSDEHGQLFNLSFCYHKPHLRTVHGFAAETAYLLFIPTITPSNHALNRLVKQWRATSYAQMIDPRIRPQENMYRL